MGARGASRLPHQTTLVRTSNRGAWDFAPILAEEKAGHWQSVYPTFAEALKAQGVRRTTIRAYFAWKRRRR